MSDFEKESIRELLVDAKTVAAIFNEAVYSAYGYWKNRRKELVDHNPDEYVNIVVKDRLQELLGETLISWEDIRESDIPGDKTNV